MTAAVPDSINFLHRIADHKFGMDIERSGLLRHAIFVDHLKQQLGAVKTDLFDRTAHGGQRGMKERGVAAIVKSRYGDVVGYSYVFLVDRFHCADGHIVVEAKYGRGQLAFFQKLAHRLVAALQVEITDLGKLRVKGNAILSKRVHKPFSPVNACLEVLFPLDQSNLSVPLPDDVFRHIEGPFFVVGDDVDHIALSDFAVKHGQRDFLCQHMVDKPVVLNTLAHQDNAVEETFINGGERWIIVDAFYAKRVLIPDHIVRPYDYVMEEVSRSSLFQCGEEQSKIVGFGQHKAFRIIIRHVVICFGYRLDLVLGLLPDQGAVVQGARDCGMRHIDDPGNILYCNAHLDNFNIRNGKFKNKIDLVYSSIFRRICKRAFRRRIPYFILKPRAASFSLKES